MDEISMIMFADYDRDGDGVATIDEVQDMLDEWMGVENDIEEHHEDEEGVVDYELLDQYELYLTDQFTGEVGWGEFEAYINEELSNSSDDTRKDVMNSWALLFSKVDRDGDMHVDVEELVEAYDARVGSHEDSHEDTHEDDDHTHE